MTFEVQPVDLKRDLKLCLQFRRDAWQVSYGSLESFREDETTDWFEFLAEKYPESFLHVLQDHEVIGQLEFRSRPDDDTGEHEGYINLLYLIPEWRGKGMGQATHDFILKVLSDNGCTRVFLRYVPGNDRAEAFYLKNGWIKEGKPTEKRGQLMKKVL
ncbi:GNAT family N-acetyltransferase [Endozoicomonas arenosclerae]|uniref:GNAT family N-acetyltransferase n=1 Tax=Endozoicomonas arenosclerae TaxID=1633495 RepID=UPI0007808BC4|nr:GNAT family N-acetyltransferase [Endozoicomonas arenosclerae]